jgi:UDP-N-acetylglucosamine diphosphorylase/glucosamine-1-phosphate N-acetyltransferase
MKIVLFEDSGFRNLLPLTYFRPVWELRCGIYDLKEKIKYHLTIPKVYYTARQYLMDFYLEESLVLSPESGGEYLFINGRLLLGSDDSEKILNVPEKTVFLSEKSIVAWRGDGQSYAKYFEQGVLQSDRLLNDFTQQQIKFQFIDYPWDLIDFNGEEIVKDCHMTGQLGKLKGRIDPGVHIMGKEKVFLAKSASLLPGVVIDAESGPVWIDDNVKIMPQAVLQGPLSIGPDSIIKIGAKIYENTTIGPVCKVGGEVEESIFHGFSNKQHDGFLGHSYLGSWINLGADTNNSDLKNNYSPISVILNKQKIETGRRFLGAIIGDHSKTAINTMINTGSIIGVCSNIFGAGFPPKSIPSFSWGGSAGFQAYDFDKAVKVARIVMERRNISFTDKHLKLFQAVKDLISQVE